ncbi:MAG: family 16 glycosylhydrolase [Phycisphaerales bacterium JB037]
MHARTMLVCSMLLTPFAAAAQSATQPTDQPTHQPADFQPPLPGYTLFWHDEFNGDTLDTTRWSVWRPGPRRDAINVPEAVVLDGQGHLTLTTTRHQLEDGTTEFRTGGVWTHDTFRTRYGYFEARMKMQQEFGHWAAFWIQTPTMGKVIGDPGASGVEIDVIEYHKKQPGIAQNTIHWDGYGDDHKSAHHKHKLPDIAEGWHTYAVLWTPDELVFYVDGKESWRTDAAVPRVEQFMILSLEVGTWAGDINAANLPDGIMIDWVRVWKPGNAESVGASEDSSPE